MFGVYKKIGTTEHTEHADKRFFYFSVLHMFRG